MPVAIGYDAETKGNVTRERNGIWNLSEWWWDILADGRNWFSSVHSKRPIIFTRWVWCVVDYWQKWKTKIYFLDPKYYKDSDGNYWLDYGDGKGYVPYSPEMERLANGYYVDENGDYWEQSDEGLNRYTPEIEPLNDGYYQNKEDGYWVKDSLGFRIYEG